MRDQSRGDQGLLLPLPPPQLDIYKEESRFILEVRNERGSAAAEKVIIALIALEIIVNALFHVYHH